MANKGCVSPLEHFKFYSSGLIVLYDPSHRLTSQHVPKLEPTLYHFLTLGF